MPSKAAQFNMIVTGRKSPDGRLSAARRGYGARWQRYRKSYLKAHPLCVMFCKEEGKTTPATVVDHIVPHKGDPMLFWAPTNHQAGCVACNSRKAALLEGGFGNRQTPSGEGGKISKNLNPIDHVPPTEKDCASFTQGSNTLSGEHSLSGQNFIEKTAEEKG